MKLKNNELKNELKISQPPCVDSCLAAIKRLNTRLSPSSVGKIMQDFSFFQIAMKFLAFFCLSHNALAIYSALLFNTILG